MKSYFSVIFFLLVLISFDVNAQKLNSEKSTTLRFESYSCGDGCYFGFTDINTGEVYTGHYYELFMLNKKDEIYIDEIVDKCVPDEDCILTGQLYDVILTYKKAPIVTMTEDGDFIKSKRTTRKWVVTSFKKKK